MSYREKLEKSIEEMNENGGVTFETWNMFLLTSIANSLAVIADNLEIKGAKNGDEKR